MFLNFLAYIYHLLGWKFPAVFSYFSTRMILAAFTSLVLTLFLGPFFIRKLYALKIGQSIRTAEECPFLAALHEKKKNTPTMGGVLILFSMIVSMILWMDFHSSFTWILLITTLWLGFLGGMDDYLKLKYKNSKGLKSKKKFLGQLIFAALLGAYLYSPIQESNKVFSPVTKEQKQSLEKNKSVVFLQTKKSMSSIYVPFFKKPIVLKGIFVVLGFLFVMFIVVGTSNAVNLTDGLDGLAAGSIILVAFVLALVAFLSNHIAMAKYLNILYIEGSGDLAIFLFAMIGSCIGFLWYNGYPAQIFMGDTGSLALGGILGVSAVLLRRELLLGLVGGVFVAEALSVILQVLSYRYRNKKRIFLCAPLHHHYEYKGWAETKVVLRFWIIGLLLAIIGIASLKFQ